MDTEIEAGAFSLGDVIYLRYIPHNIHDFIGPNWIRKFSMSGDPEEPFLLDAPTQKYRRTGEHLTLLRFCGTRLVEPWLHGFDWNRLLREWFDLRRYFSAIIAY